jgi:hypothetical protein
MRASPLRLIQGQATRRTIFFALFLVSSCALPALAQTSASYHLNEHVLNAGGQPAGGTALSSASFRVRLEAIGDPVVGTGMTSASFHGTGGFVGDYPPPGEVQGLAFTSPTAMVWSPEKSVGHYEVYRDLISALGSGGTGTCFQSSLTTEAATDATSPAVGNG